MIGIVVSEMLSRSVYISDIWQQFTAHVKHLYALH